MNNYIFNKAFNKVIENCEVNIPFCPIVTIINNESYIHDGTTNLTYGEISSKVEELGVSKGYFKPAEKNGEFILIKKGIKLKNSKKHFKEFEEHLNKKSVFTLGNMNIIYGMIIAAFLAILAYFTYLKEDSKTITNTTIINTKCSRITALVISNLNSQYELERGAYSKAPNRLIKLIESLNELSANL
jgi:hypothetical protein